MIKIGKMHFILPSLVFAVLISACTPDTKRIEVKIEQPTIPVLVKKEISPTIKINLCRKDKVAYTVEEIAISLNETHDLDDIVKVGIYGVDKKGMIDPSQNVYETKEIKQTFKIKETISVDSDTISFWVGVTLKDSINLSHRIGVECESILTSDGKIVMPKDIKANPLRIGVAVRQKDQDNVVSSRIPGLDISKSGTLLSIFDARYDSPRDLQGHMDIGLHRSKDRGATWEPLQIVLDMKEWGSLPEKLNGVSDACILVDQNSNDIYIAGLWMHGVLDDNGKWIKDINEATDFWKHQWGKKGSQPGLSVKQTSQFLITKSSDDGLTWSEPVNITEQTKLPEWWLFAPAPGHGISLKDGTLVFPTQGRDKDGEPFSNITWSKDQGKTWITSAPAYNNVTESMAVELSDGSIMLNMRDNRNRGNKEENGRRICVTTDLGKTWKEHPTSRKALIEPTCMASIHKHKYTEGGVKKSMLLFVNPSSHDTRNNITLKVSFDDGNTWPEDKWILLDAYRSAAYSCITSIDENTIGILYESSQANLAFIQVKTDEILNQKPQ